MWAGYLGLFAILPYFAPFALIVGLVALLPLRRNPELKGRARAWFGFLMGALFTTLLVVMFVVIASHPR